MGVNKKSRAKALTPRLIVVITELEPYDGFETAPSMDAAYLYQLSAAHREGYSEPFTSEQAALNDFLSRIQAGKELVNKAWKGYAKAASQDS